MIDTNVTLYRWPFRRLPGDDPADLVQRLRRKGVTQAWAGSFDGLLYRDITAVNSRLAADCRKHGADFLLPFGSINPTLPDWQEDLRRCSDEHHMLGIRLHPGYHGYTLRDAVFSSLIEAAATRNLIVQLVWTLEDERTQNPLVRVPPVDLAPLADLIPRMSGLRLVILNWKNVLTGDLARGIADAGEVYYDFAMLEGVGGLEKLLPTSV